MSSSYRQINRHRQKSGSNRQHHSFFSQLGLYVIVGMIAIVIIITISSFFQAKMNVSSTTLKNWTTSISKETLISALSMEIPQLRTYNKSVDTEVPKASNIVLEMVTSFNPQDPRSLIRGELPGFSFFDGQIVVAGQGVHYTDIPIESAPPMEVLLKDREAVLNGNQVNGEGPTKTTEQALLNTEGRKVVFIYHTHNRESWIPHVSSAAQPDEAYHSEVNMTLIGERLGEELEKRGIGTHVDTTDITKLLNEQGIPYSLSYAKSREVVETALAQQKDITFMFDLHRDALRRDQTTVEINGKSYARTYFVIGGQNRNHKKNLAFAERFHDMMEDAYPGLSRGVYFKESGNGEYNQSLSENNVLIEIGGVDNTLEESYRTAEALADVIADLYWDAEKVDASS